MWEIPTLTKEQEKRVDRINAKRDGSAYPCVICKLLCPNPKHHVRLYIGSYLITREEANSIIAESGIGFWEAGDCGWYPVGPECWKKHKTILLKYSIPWSNGHLVYVF